MSPDWTADIVVDITIATAVIARQFPQLAGASVEPFGEGWDNAAFLVDQRWVFRFPRRRVAVPLMESERRLLPAIATQLPLPVPNPCFQGEPCDEFPWPFAGYARIAGRQLSEASFDVARSDEAAAACGAFLRALHAMPLNSLPAIPGDTLGRLDSERSMPKLRARLEELQRAGLIRGAAAIVDAAASLSADGARPERACLVHGDLYARHILEEGGRISGVIDWGDAHAGDPAVNLAIGITCFEPVARAAFAQAYGPIDERTWELARFRAIYSSALVGHYAHNIDDRPLRAWALNALKRSRTSGAPHA